MSQPQILLATKNALLDCVKKTPLTDKLLSRPPFRFLHDLVMEISANTGYLSSLFSDSEKDSANVSVL